jgi:endonuclease-3
MPLQAKSIKFKKTSSKQAQEMMGLLCKYYPDADCELLYKNDFELLIAVILSAQCTDVTVNKVTPGLFKAYGTAHKMATADLDDLKKLIKPTGFFNSKAQNIQSCARALVEKFDGKVPRTREELVSLSGVGRKTANVVLGVLHNIPGWTVDTHVQRLSKRLGFTKQDDPLKIEKDLEKLFPKQDWSKLSITLIWHGRRICFARKPNCKGCPINHLCPSAQI